MPIGSLQVASSKLEAETVNVKLADMTVLKARGFYGLGRASLSDVLNSYSHALDAKKNLAQAMYDRVFALSHIKTALGAGLANFEAAPATTRSLDCLKPAVVDHHSNAGRHSNYS